MTSAPTLALSYRKRGTRTWVELDPSSEQGARLLNSIGVQIARRAHPKLEEKEAMTTTAIRRDAPRTTLAPPAGMTQSERFAWALRAREWIAARATQAMSLPRRIMRRLVEVFHLEGVIEAVKSGWAWLKTKAAWAMDMMGVSGMLGLGMISLSTGTGRSAIGYALKPIGWLGKGLSWVDEKVKAGLMKLGKPGIWVASKIEDTESWFIKKGLAVKGWWNKNVAKHVKLDSTPMRTARLGGVLLLARRAILAFGLPLPVSYLLGAIVAVWSVYDAAGLAMKVGEDRGWIKVTEEKATGAKTATASGTAKVTTPGATAKATTPSHGGNRKH